MTTLFDGYVLYELIKRRYEFSTSAAWVDGRRDSLGERVDSVDEP